MDPSKQPPPPPPSGRGHPYYPPPPPPSDNTTNSNQSGNNFSTPSQAPASSPLPPQGSNGARAVPPPAPPTTSSQGPAPPPPPPPSGFQGPVPTPPPPPQQPPPPPPPSASASSVPPSSSSSPASLSSPSPSPVAPPPPPPAASSSSLSSPASSSASSSVPFIDRKLTVYVGRIAPELDNDVLQRILETCGHVETMKRLRDPVAEERSSFAFCVYKSIAGAVRAMSVLEDVVVGPPGDPCLFLKVDQAAEGLVGEYHEHKARLWQTDRQSCARHLGLGDDDVPPQDANVSLEETEKKMNNRMREKIDSIISECKPTLIEERERRKEKKKKEREQMEQRIREEQERAERQRAIHRTQQVASAPDNHGDPQRLRTPPSPLQSDATQQKDHDRSNREQQSDHQLEGAGSGAGDSQERRLQPRSRPVGFGLNTRRPAPGSGQPTAPAPVSQYFNPEEDEDGLSDNPWTLSRRLKMETATDDDKKEKEEINPEEIVSEIPTEKERLFAYPVEWSLVDRLNLAERLRPWVSKKITKYLGEEEPSMVDHVVGQVAGHANPQELLDDLEPVLDQEAQFFVVTLWRMLIYEQKASKAKSQTNST